MQTKHRSPSALTLAVATVVAGWSAAAFAGETPGAVTVSISGSTAMRNFTISPSFTALTPGTSINVNGQIYSATDSGSTNVQLAYEIPASADAATGVSVTTANYLAYRVEWHEQGSVEGVAELANDQIGYFSGSPIVDAGTRNPVASPGNAVYVQRNVINAAPYNNGSFTLASSTYNTYANYNAAGSNLQGGQNRVQMAISDVRAAQGFSVVGTPAFDRKAGQAGYGKGNPALLGGSSLLGLANANVRRQLIDQSALNMDATKIDPKTGAAYATGAWNTAGVANTDNKVVAVTATTFAANPGTGLSDLNRTDAQWLQATGRLANGANFNVATRDINSGTLNVAAQNVGLDPSFAVGENDDGNGLGTVNQTTVGANIRFSGKTAGGAQMRPTLQNARMAVGHLSLSDVRGVSVASAANPLRVLGYRNTADNTGAAVQPSFDSISDGSYALFQNQTYVTVKDPTSGAAAITAYQAANPGATAAQAWAALTDAQTGIKGDNSGNDVADLRNNILNSAASFPASSAFRTPANGLVSTGFIPPKFMQMMKAGDGEAVVNNPNFDSANYGAVKAAAGSNFTVGAADAVTTGTGSTYGRGANAIPITATNYLFGDFNGDAKRDFQDIKYAQAGQAALGSANTDYTTGNNAVAAYNGFTKGDLIVKGDFNADGKFDGADLGAMARGTSLADAGKTAAQLANPDNAQLTTASGATVSDRYRAGVLYKNAALDYLQANATAAQKAQGSASAANDPTGANAFNKFDVNRDGRVDRDDAGIVDSFVDRDYRNLADQLSAVVATSANAAGTRFVGNPTVDQITPRKGISLVDVELNDTGTITHVAPAGGTSDFKLIRQALGTLLLDGDTDFDGGVSINDFNVLAGSFGQSSGQKWSTGDFDFDGGVSINDFNLLAGAFGQSAPANSPMWAGLLAFAAAHNDLAAFEAVTGVPEPTGMAVIAAAGAVGLRRRRR